MIVLLTNKRATPKEEVSPIKDYLNVGFGVSYTEESKEGKAFRINGKSFHEQFTDRIQMRRVDLERKQALEKETQLEMYRSIKDRDFKSSNDEECNLSMMEGGSFFLQLPSIQKANETRNGGPGHRKFQLKSFDRV
mmetsp:Transcript_22562/g.21730  ORF Transcript_22562/g.21730 Transcript_22562/m.21730 type:complete len:136 (+) Transcript_22562:358-765(+)